MEAAKWGHFLGATKKCLGGKYREQICGYATCVTVMLTFGTFAYIFQPRTNDLNDWSKN
jgi:hypothetical protein